MATTICCLANFIHDGARLWLIDWDYAGFNSPLFDLGGLAAKNGLREPQEALMSQQYFGQTDAPLAALPRDEGGGGLRETLWSMVSGKQHSEIAFDYAAIWANS